MPSSVLRAMRFYPAAQVLDLTFRDNRGVYRYFDVSMEEWEAFCAASSKGTYLNHTFKAAGHGFRKIAASGPVRAMLAAELPTGYALEAELKPEDSLFWEGEAATSP